VLRTAIQVGDREILVDVDGRVLERLVEVMYDPESFRVMEDEQVLKGAQVLHLTTAEPMTPPSGPQLISMSASPTHSDMHCSQILVGHSGYVYCLAITSSGLIVSGSRDHTIRVWTPFGELVRELRVHLNRVWCLLALKTLQGKELILSGSWDKTINVIDPLTWTVLGTLTGHEDWVTCLLQVNRYLVSASADSTLRVWDIELEFQEERVMRGHIGHIYALCSLGNGQYIVSGGQDSVLRVWETTHWREQKVLAGHKGTVRALCEWGDWLLSGASDGQIFVWGCSLGFEKISSVQAHDDWIEALVVLDNDRFASGSRDESVCIWNRDLQCKQKLTGHSHWVGFLLLRFFLILMSEPRHI